MQVVALGYLAVMIVGTLLLALPCSSREGTWTGFTDAFMTSTSAACVTGLIPVSTYHHWSAFGQAVLLVLMQVGRAWNNDPDGVVHKAAREEHDPR